MIKVLLLDKEQNVLNYLDDFFSAKQKYFVIGKTKSLVESYELIVRKSPDLVIVDVDINYSKIDEFLIEMVKKCNFKIIFLTKNIAFAQKAVVYNPIDFILKPVSKHRLIESLIKFEGLFYRNQKDHHIIINTTGNIFKFRLEEIIFFKASGNYTIIFIKDGRKITTSKTLNYYNKMVLSNLFFRIHYSYFVNLNFMKRYEKKERRIYLEKDYILPVSVRREKDFLKQLNILI
jgi:two-component system LytT family response regulator